MIFRKQFASILSLVVLMSVLFSCSGGEEGMGYTNKRSKGMLVFSAIGDVPYSAEEEQKLNTQIQSHNDSSISQFVIHLGDIKTGSQECDETRYQNVSAQLKNFKAVTFIVPGDNEYNDCADPAKGWFYWRSYFYRFHEFWTNDFNLEYSEERGENFAFKESDVLFVGLNIVGGTIHDQAEWNQRLKQNADWFAELIEKHKYDVNAVVVFGHANLVDFDPEKFDLFTIPFRQTAASFNKPILYLHGDGHEWIKDRPWDEKNLLRVQVDEGAQILQISIDTSKEDPFLFNRTAF